MATPIGIHWADIWQDVWQDVWATEATIPSGQPDSGGGRSQWVRGARYPWEKDEEPRKAKKKDLEKVKVTLELVEEALDEIGEYGGIPFWWHQQNPKAVKRAIPNYVYVPDNHAPGYDHKAAVEAVMRKIAEDAERDDEEALMLMMLQ